MAYTINKTNGSIFAVVADGTINTDSSLVLVGKNYSGYGEFLNENFMKLLENAANATPPAEPLTGELWYDTTAGILKVYNGAVFKELTVSTSGTTPPPVGERRDGELWWDSVARQLKIWSTALNTWLIVGPAYSSDTGVTGPITDTIRDTLGVDHVVTKFYVSDQIVAILSGDPTFTPQVPIPGFTVINPGLNFAATIGGVVPVFNGTANNALNLGGLPASEYVRKTGPGEVMDTSLAVRSSNGLRVGVNQDFKVSVSGSTVKIENVTASGNLVVGVRGASADINAITVTGTTGAVSLAATLTVGGTVMPTTNNAFNMGSATTMWNTVFATTFNGVATSAQYADLAEKFVPDAEYPVGTVVTQGGAEEITAELEDASPNVHGVVSTAPAYLMNSSAGGIAVALIGRVPVRVVGPVAKHARLVSAGNGAARAATIAESSTPGLCIGRALASKTTTEEGLVEVFVRL